MPPSRPSPPRVVAALCVLVLLVVVSALVLVLVGRRRRRPVRRILVAVCCIDPRAGELPDCRRALAGLKIASRTTLLHFVCVVRESDQRCRSLGAGLFDAVLTVPDYPNPMGEEGVVDFGRHHFAGIASQRTRALEHARARGDDAVFFVDSDIRVHPDTLHHLLAGLAWRGGADVVAVPYGVRWNNMQPTVARVTTAASAAETTGVELVTPRWWWWAAPCRYERCARTLHEQRTVRPRHRWHGLHDGAPRLGSHPTHVP